MTDTASAPAADSTDSEKTRTYERAAAVEFTVAEGDFEFEPVFGNTQNKGRERRDDLKALDALVIASREDGKPRFVMIDGRDTKAVTDLEKNIRNAGRHTKNGLRFGKYIPAPNQPKGMILVSFLAVPIREKKKTDTAPAADTATTATEPASPAPAKRGTSK